LGELELIRTIRERIGKPGRGTVVGVGDDAAVYDPPSGLELLTCDAFVEGVHFRRDFATLWEIGAKCMVANVSDIAAMGGFPARAVVSICVPGDAGGRDVEELYEGMLDVCGRYAVEIVGGDVVASNQGFVISIALLGVVGRDRVVTRSGAIVGDILAVTGRLGASEAGLLSLVEGLPDDAAVREARRKHLLPVPRLPEAQALIDVATPRAMIDVSDGLSSDVWHLAEESDVTIVLHEAGIPVAPVAEEIARRLGLDPIELALSSGEEFELIVAIPPSEMTRAAEHVVAVTGTELHRIGEVVRGGAGCALRRRGGSEEPLRRTGYEHLAGARGRGGAGR
jgi:thiamine-monophosphate kinase